MNTAPVILRTQSSTLVTPRKTVSRNRRRIAICILCIISINVNSYNGNTINTTSALPACHGILFRHRVEESLAGVLLWAIFRRWNNTSERKDGANG